MTLPPLVARCALAAGILLASLTTLARADDEAAESVRRAVMGHEAFIVRCVDDTIDATLKRAYRNSQDRQRKRIRDQVRDFCETYYTGVNVCVPGGADEAIAKLEQTKKEIEAMLADPLTRADRYDAISSLGNGLDRELTALRDLAEGRSGYCGARSGEE